MDNIENQVDLTGLVEFVSQAKDEHRILLITDDGSRLLVVVVADADGLPERGQRVRVQGRLGSRCLRKPLAQALARLLHRARAGEVAPDVRALLRKHHLDNRHVPDHVVVIEASEVIVMDGG